MTCLSLLNVDELQRLKGLIAKLENAYKDAQYRNQIIEFNYQKKSLDHDELVERIMGEKKVSRDCIRRTSVITCLNERLYRKPMPKLFTNIHKVKMH